MATRKPAVAFIFITLLLEVLGFGLLIPVGPKLIQSLVPRVDGSLGGSYSEAASYYGLLVSTYSVMTFFFAPVLGALSDRFGRRPVLLIALLGTGLDYFAMALVPNLWLLFVTRAINGLSGASMTVCNAYVADVTPPEKRAAAFGMVGAAFGLGFVLGPIAGGLLGNIDIHLPFYVAGGLSIVNWFYGWFVLPESLVPERRSHLSLARMNPIGVFAGLSRYPLVAGLAVALFLLNFAMFMLHATWVLYTGHKFAWGPVEVGLSLTLVGVGAAIVQGGLARRIIPALGPGALGEKRALLLGLGMGVLSYLGYAAATHGWMIYAIIAVASIGGVAQPAAQALITKTVHSDEQGAVQGALTGLQGVANIFAPIVGSQVFAYFISDRAPAHIAGASYFLSSVLALAGLLVAARVLRNVHTAATPAA